MKKVKKGRGRKKNGAELLVECLQNQGVDYIFGVPGASILPILDALADKGPKYIICRHEQNASLMAQAWGRITGKPGVCMATAGPGATNLLTGVGTATAERDPVVAITGQVPHAQRFKKGHQSIDTVSLFKPVSKWSFEIPEADAIPEAVANAFRVAQLPREGAVHLSIPNDVQIEAANAKPFKSVVDIELGISSKAIFEKAALAINSAKRPVVLLGISSSKPKVTKSVRKFLKKTQISTVGTFQAAGAVSRDLVHLFVGRVGLNSKEAGDVVLGKADLIISIGYDPVEYEPGRWNKLGQSKIIHIDELISSYDQKYKPDLEITGDIAKNLDALTERVTVEFSKKHQFFEKAQSAILKEQQRGAKLSGKLIHPLRLIHDIRKTISDDVTVISDVGSSQLWLAHYFYSYEPRHLLFSMGAQTMGVSLPWAVGAALARPGKQVISNSGDGAFMMTCMALETAVREKLPIVHFIWRDGTYNLIQIQQMAEYGRTFGSQFGNIDFVSMAKSFGATAYRINKSAQIIPTLKKAMKVKGPVVIEVPIDYKDNMDLIKSIDLSAAGD